MGINNRLFDIINSYARRNESGRALIAGYPDMLVYPEFLNDAFGRCDFPRDEASEEIVRQHAEPRLNYAREPQAVFKALGYEIDIIDIHTERGCERIVDLNLGGGVGVGFYDLVLDHGTIEHCFNIGMAARTLANAVKVGGMIIQHLPMNMNNHGFYNINPTWFGDFYSVENGFKIEALEGWCWGNKQSFEVPLYTGFTGLPEYCLLTCVARRTKEVEITWPMQRKYR